MERGPVGVIGQGYVGSSYADYFESEDRAVVRYSLDPAHADAKEKIRECRVVLVAVPTPTRDGACDTSALEQALSLIGSGSFVLIKSTVPPGTTARLQSAFPELLLFHSPEFLSEATAAHDARNPFITILGMGVENAAYEAAAQELAELLPAAPRTLVCTSGEAELCKYAHNTSGYFQVVFFNLLYDFAAAHGMSWERIQSMIEADPFMAGRYANPLHGGGRGAGGRCFVKDFEAFLSAYRTKVDDPSGISVLTAVRDKNIELLRGSGKSVDLVADVYGA